MTLCGMVVTSSAVRTFTINSRMTGSSVSTDLKDFCYFEFVTHIIRGCLRPGEKSDIYEAYIFLDMSDR